MHGNGYYKKTLDGFKKEKTHNLRSLWLCNGEKAKTGRLEAGRNQCASCRDPGRRPLVSKRQREWRGWGGVGHGAEGTQTVKKGKSGFLPQAQALFYLKEYIQIKLEIPGKTEAQHKGRKCIHQSKSQLEFVMQGGTGPRPLAMAEVRYGGLKSKIC